MAHITVWYENADAEPEAEAWVEEESSETQQTTMTFDSGANTNDYSSTQLIQGIYEDSHEDVDPKSSRLTDSVISFGQQN